MSRVINPDGVGKERTRLTRAVVIAIREMMQQNSPNSTTRDAAAFIALALPKISETIERTIVPWEKRGYWLKADKFMLEWEWLQPLGTELQSALFNKDWAQIALSTAKVGEKLSKVKVPIRHRLGTPWIGAWDKLKESQT